VQGKPLPGTGRAPSAKIYSAPRARNDEQGKFVLGTYDSEDGVPAGEYRITVHWHQLVQNGGSFEPGPDVVPPQYSNPAQTALRVSIAAGENQIPPLNLRR
jgi:hypothetical protein